TSITVLNSHRMHLVAEGTDGMTTKEVRKFTGQTTEQEREETTGFNAHLIYHGPKLKMLDAGTEVTTKNDFLGEAASSTADTHQCGPIFVTLVEVRFTRSCRQLPMAWHVFQKRIETN